MVICLMQDMTSWLVGMTHWTDALQLMHWQPIDLIGVLDKKIEVDLMGDVQKAVNNFIKTGQVWAFLIGLLFGYLVKTFTSYG